MSDAWVVVVLVSACAIAFKVAGPVAIGGRQLPLWMLGMVAALAPALLAALVVTQVIQGDRAIVLDERLIGLAAAAATIALRAPVLVVVVAAATATGLARAV